MNNIRESSTSFIDTSLVDEFYPINGPLTGKYKKGFAYKTIGYRLPIIITKIIDQLSRDKNEIRDKVGEEARGEIKEIVGKLAKLKNEMQTNKPLTLVNNSVWNNYLGAVASEYFESNKDEVRWYFAPWLYVECYLYWRVHEAFSLTTHLSTYDYFEKQKQEGFYDSVHQASVLGHFILTTSPSADTMTQLLQVCLWGNRCDLSLSGGEKNSQEIHLLDHLHLLEPLILANESPLFLSQLELITNRHEGNSIGYILDNSGFELFTDLCFSHLLSSVGVKKIVFYVKVIPWYVSDALVHDIHWMLDVMEKREEEILNKLALLWKEHLQEGRWVIELHPFWTYPHYYSQMPSFDPMLYSELSSHGLLIFKGDLNYRKLIGDKNWAHSTPFKNAVENFSPCPLVAIRTCKADVVVGLPSGLSEKLSAEDDEWMITGKYGLIQFAK